MKERKSTKDKIIVIMKTTSRPGYMDWVRPHAVFEGSLKDAKKVCEELNKKATINVYNCISVKVIS
jgi:hypothetical protein